MKGLIFIFILVSSSSSLASIESMLKSILNNAKSCDFDSDYSNYFETDEIKQRVTKVDCSVPETKLYQNIQIANCIPRFSMSGKACVEYNKNKIEGRISNLSLMEKIKSYTQKRFQEYKSNLLEECCGNKQRCKNKFQNVSLEFSPKISSFAQYVSSSSALDVSLYNRIQMSLGKLASAYNTENIDRVLLVELGHACQYSLNSENDSTYNKFTSKMSECSKEAGLLSFKEGLGEEMAQCLINEIESQIASIPESEKNNYCFGHWYKEAFSDMKFRKHFTSIYHWMYDLTRRTPAQNYANVSRYIKCGFGNDIKKEICLK